MTFAPRAEYHGKPIDDWEAWRKLLNVLYIYEDDELFKWAKLVRAAVCSDSNHNVPIVQGRKHL
jgi:hypothetical protein